MTPTSDPLASLAPLRMPEAISWWPLAPGWWFVITLTLVAISALLWFVIRHRRANAYRRVALKQLHRLQHTHADNPSALAQALNALLKATALNAYPAQQCASLSGSSWLEFLNKTLPAQDAPPALANAPYQPDTQVDATALIDYAKRWITQHRSAIA